VHLKQAGFITLAKTNCSLEGWNKRKHNMEIGKGKTETASKKVKAGHKSQLNKKNIKWKCIGHCNSSKGEKGAEKVSNNGKEEKRTRKIKTEGCGGTYQGYQPF
jgi:hypothetical protein